MSTIHPGNGYRSHIPTIIKFFRPVLAQLNIRSKDKHEQVFLASFEHLDFLNLEKVVIVVIPADIKNAKGVFFCRHIENKLTHCYIVIDKSLYSESTLERVKIIGVHEFCHFMAIVYTLTAATIEIQKEGLLKRLEQKIDTLNSSSLNRLYEELNRKIDDDNIKSLEFDDSHFRLQYEGSTPDYALLFKHFMFSRELFEEYFKKDEQDLLKKTSGSKNTKEAEKIIDNFLDTIERVANEKSVPFRLAVKQVFSWVQDYLK